MKNNNLKIQESQIQTHKKYILEKNQRIKKDKNLKEIAIIIYKNNRIIVFGIKEKSTTIIIMILKMMVYGFHSNEGI